MLLEKQLPKFIPDLVPALTHLDGDQLSGHLNTQILTINRSICNGHNEYTQQMTEVQQQLKLQQPQIHVQQDLFDTQNTASVHKQETGDRLIQPPMHEQKQYRQQEVSYGFQNIIDKLDNGISNAVTNLAQGFDQFKQSSSQQQVVESAQIQSEDQQQIQQNQISQQQANQIPVIEQQRQIDGEIPMNPPQNQNIQKIQQIRRKQAELLQQLKLLKWQEEQLIRNKNANKQQSNQSQSSPIADGKYGVQSMSKYQVNKIKGDSLSPVRNRRLRYSKPKPMAPSQPSQPEMTRQEFELKIKEMASNIRSKVKKNNPLTLRESIKNKSESKDKKYKYKIDFIQLPEIETKSTIKNKMVNSFLVNETNDGVEQIEGAQQQIENNSNAIAPTSSSPKIQIAIRSIVIQIVKKAMQKIVYKQKYGIKLDPIHHKYPMTSFRKKVIEEKYDKSKQRSVSQSLRQSMLHQRKQIFDKSRILSKIV